MIRKLLAASAAVLFVIGLTTAADEKKDEPTQVTGKFVKFNAEKNEITIKVKSEEMTYPLAKDAKVAIGAIKETKDLSKLKVDDPIMLTLRKDGDKTWVMELREPKPDGSGKN